jgi:ABC-type sugar transport system, periplasmic component
MRKFLVCVIALIVFSTAAFSGEIVLRFSWWGASERHEATLAAIKEFEAKNPGVTIKGEYMGWDGYLERLTTQIGAGAEADIMQIDWAWLPMFSKEGAGFLDLLQYTNVLDISQFDKKWLDTGMVKGKLNALPVSFGGQVEVWNKTTWDKAGLPLPKTWDDLLAAGAVFQEKLGKDYFPLDLHWHEISLLTHSYIFQKTGRQYINPDKPAIDLTREELVEWMDFYKALSDAKAIPHLSNRISIGGDSYRTTHEFVEWVEGKWAGTMTWDAHLSVRMSTIRDEFEYVLGDFLTMPEAKNLGRIGRPSMMFAVSKNTKNPEMAAKFLNFMLCTEEGAKNLKSTRGVLLSKIGFETTEREGLINPLIKAAMEQILNTECYTPSPYFEHVRIKEMLRQVIEGVGLGNYTSEQAADILLNEGGRILRRLDR